MENRYSADPGHYSGMDTDSLRKMFLIETLFAAGKIEMVYTDADRAIVGSVVPAGEKLTLGTADELRAEFFCQRREVGVLNVGARGTVTADGKAYEMENLDCLYVGRGTREISFASADAGSPAKFYLLSYPAHANHPTTLARKAQATPVNLGSVEGCNKRTIYKFIHTEGVKSCQLVMGFTQMEVGSCWNTMPPHTHARRSEVYMYFDLPAAARVFHMMGPGRETRHLVVADGQAVISPSWSIHAGVGTTSYCFCWGMGGENQQFDDMDGIKVGELR